MQVLIFTEWKKCSEAKNCLHFHGLQYALITCDSTDSYMLTLNSVYRKQCNFVPFVSLITILLFVHTQGNVSFRISGHIPC
jgi:hypothetical protein